MTLSTEDKILLDQAQTMIQCSVCAMTRKHYDYQWQHWQAFATDRKWNVLLPTPQQLLIYLQSIMQDLTSTANAASYLNQARSALAAGSLHIQDILPKDMFHRFTRGNFNLNPPVPSLRLRTMWDPDDIINYIKSKDPNKLTLKELGSFTAVLLLLSTSCRKGELLLLALDRMQKHGNDVMFQLTRQLKMYSLANPDTSLLEFWIRAYPPDRRPQSLPSDVPQMLHHPPNPVNKVLKSCKN